MLIILSLKRLSLNLCPIATKVDPKETVCINAHYDVPLETLKYVLSTHLKGHVPKITILSSFIYPPVFSNM